MGNSKRLAFFKLVTYLQKMFTNVVSITVFYITLAIFRDRPIFGFYRYIGIGQNGRYYRPQQELTKRCCIPHASRQLAQESTTKQVKTVILQQS